MFETVDGTRTRQAGRARLLHLCRLPGLLHSDQLAAVADKIEGEKWVMGEFGEQKGVEEQFGQLGPVLIERYGKDFVDAWNKVLDNLKLKSMSADKPQYLALSAASSPTSPIRQLFEAVAPRNAADARAGRGRTGGRSAEQSADRQRRCHGRRRRRSRNMPPTGPRRAQTGLGAHRHRPGDEEVAKPRRRHLRRPRRPARFPAPISRRSSGPSTNW